MLNNLRARIMRYCELSWDDLKNLKAWAKRSASFNSFPPETFSSPSLKVAVATDADGKVVCMTPIETCYMVSAFLVSPEATSETASMAGDLIDAELAASAARAGVSKLLIVLPADHPCLKDNPEWADFREVRVYERKFNQTLGTGGIRLSKPAQATQFLN